MTNYLDDALVNTLEIIWEETEQYSGPKVVSSPSELRVLRDFLTTKFWQSRIRFIASGVIEKHGRTQQYSGFMFPDDLDPDDEQFEGVMLFDPLDTIYISEHSFMKIMDKYFKTIINGVKSYGKDDSHEDWWLEFLALAERLQQKLSNH